ncbi:MAG TPA: N-6 DNA methylase, partial [Gemmatimonadaceae bacterium]
MVTERGHVVDSDAETLCALSAVSTVPGDVMRHLRWLDILGRDAVTLRFFHALSAAVTTLATSLPPRVPDSDSREMALLTTSRLLFLSFLETKAWLDSDFGFLANGFSDCMATGGSYQRRVLEPLFFGTLNTRAAERAPRARQFGRVPFLNGGLFSRTSVERIHRRSRFTDEALGALFGDVLVRFRFTAREDAATWSQTAIDPEMLGKVFESLMESGERKRGGVFYTPQHFVERVTHCALAASLQTAGLSADQAERVLSDDDHPRTPDHALLDRLSSFRILDPACGSGAFLVHALERLGHLRATLGDTRPLTHIRRFVLSRSIFGVDSNPTAVWLCELRLWLSAVIDSDERDYMQIAPLPNLDRQIRVGDSLSGNAFSDGDTRFPPSRTVAALRHRYSRSSGQRKLSLGRQLDLTERARSMSALDLAITAATFERREILRAARSRNLFDERATPPADARDRLLALRSRLRSLRRRRMAIARGAAPAFAYGTHFSDAADAGGFDAIIGNPPWVRVHNMSAEDRARYKEQYSVFRTSAWTDGARGARAGRGFAGQVDLAALFVERSTGLLTPNGTFGLLLPSKLWRSLSGGGLRQLILDR